MNAESEMAGADGLGAAPSDDKARCDDCRRIWPVGELVEPKRLSERLDPGGTVPAGECPECSALAYLLDDPLDKLAAEIGYSDGADDDETGGVDALIDYKNALEDRCRSLELSPDARRVVGQLVAEGGDVDDVEAEREVWDEIQAAFPCPD